MKMFRNLLFVTTLLSCHTVTAQDGVFDPDFGNGSGYIRAAFYNEQHAFSSDVVIQADGGIVVTGATNASVFSEAVLMRLQPDGQPDHSFNGNGLLYISFPNMHASGAASIVQPDEKIVTLVRLSNGTSHDSIALFRFLADGTPDNQFDGDGMATANLGYSYQSPSVMKRQSDGKLVIGGYVGNAQDTFDQFFVARFLPSGKLDNTFDGDGVAVTKVGTKWTNIGDMAIQPDGKILAAGYAWFTGEEDFTIVRYLPNGSLDQTFNDDGIAALPFGDWPDGATGIALRPDGKIVASGYTNQYANNSATAVVQLTADGYPDPSFHGDGFNVIQMSSEHEGARCLLLQPDGKILIGGSAWPSGASAYDMAVVRLLPHGIPDQSFDEDGVSILPVVSDNSDFMYAMAFQPDGKVVATGWGRVGNYNEVCVARLMSGITVGTHDDLISVQSMHVFPNPAADQVHLTFTITETEKLSISLSDVHGRIIHQWRSSMAQPSGVYEELLLLPQAITPGHYFIRIATEHGVKSIRLVTHNIP